MKEIDIKKMSLSEISARSGICINRDDIPAIINTNDKAFLENLLAKLNTARNINFFVETELGKHEDKVDKVALIMITLSNFLENYSGIINGIRTSTMSKTDDRSSAEEVFKKQVKNGKEILKEIDRTIFRLKFDYDGNVTIKVIDAKELIAEKKRTQNHKKIDELEEKGLHLLEIMNSVILTDLGYMVCDQGLSEYIRYQVFYNAAKKKGYTQEYEGGLLDIQEQIEVFRKKLHYDEVFPDVLDAVYDNIEYMDVEKLLLCSAYRYIEYLEEKPDLAEEAKEILEGRLRIIQEYLKGKNVRIQGYVEKQRIGENKDEVEYVNVSYRVKDFEKDMKKFRGTTYYGKAKVQEIKDGLLSGEIAFEDLEFKEFKLRREELINIAVANPQNYLYLISNGLIDQNDINRINTNITTLPRECLQILQNKELLSEDTLIELFLQGKVALEDVSLNGEIKLEQVVLEFSKENNEERQSRVSDLYKKIISSLDEVRKDEHKEEIYNKYLNTLDAKYLEVFLGLGTLKYENLQGIMTAEEWMEALKRKEISEEFFYDLQQNRVIPVEDIKSDRKLLLNELKLWENGTVDSKQIEGLGIPIDELLRMCDNGEITGKRIKELLHSEEEKDKIRRKIKSNYAYGFFNTIKPGLTCYNNKLINRDAIIALINQMKTKSQEVVDACKEGFLSGEKIAELYYQHLISKQDFTKMKEMGMITDEEEIAVLNNLTPEEMLSELEENGCKEIVNIEEIIAESTKGKGKLNRKDEITIGDVKRVINPIARNKLLELLGTDKIVTTPEQGFKGYQVYLIPKLKVAVMEKLFRQNKEKEVKPAYGDATYICELGKFLMVAGQSKQQIRAFMDVEGSSNGNVEIIHHRKSWANKLMEAIAKVNSRSRNTKR